MKIATLLSALFPWMLLFSIASPAATRPDLKPEEIVERLLDRETEAKRARDASTFVEEVQVKLITEYGSTRGSFRRSAQISYNEKGVLIEDFVQEKSTLDTIQLTAADYFDLHNLYQFFLTRQDQPKYKLKYKGTEKVDELNTYVFEIAPEKEPDPKRLTARLIRGKIWVDDHDFQIVQVRAKALPDSLQNQSLPFETRYTFVEDKYWFPAYTSVVGPIDTQTGRYKFEMTAEYSGYHRAKAKG